MSEAENRLESGIVSQASEVLAYEEFVSKDKVKPNSSATAPEIDRRGLLRSAVSLAGAATLAPLASTVMSSSAEAAEKTKEIYDAARRLIATTRIHNGLHMINVFHQGQVIPLGELNTEAPQLIEEDEIDDVFRELGFTDAIAFAERFNADFPHRAPNDKARIIEDAKFVAQMRVTRQDIRKGNPQFVNVRLAIMIWLGSEHLTKDYSRGFVLGGKRFNTQEVLKVMPDLKNALPRLMLDHDIEPRLSAILNVAKRNIRIPNLTRPSVPELAAFIKAVESIPVREQREGGILSRMNSIFYSMGDKSGTGAVFIYSQFIASPMGRQYKDVLDLLNKTALPRNGYGGSDAANTPLANTLERMPDTDPNYVTISRFLPQYGN